MKPVNFKESNLTLTAPEGEEECIQDIRAKVVFYDIDTGQEYPARLAWANEEQTQKKWVHDIEAAPPPPEQARVCMSFKTPWRPSERDREKIARGGYLLIQTIGKNFPPQRPSVILPGDITEIPSPGEQPTSMDPEVEAGFRLDDFAETGALPQRVNATGNPNDPTRQVTICSSISGGTDEVNGMPRGLTLVRRAADGSESMASYVQVEGPQV